jgi:predicted PurR-regulated permease PerM
MRVERQLWFWLAALVVLTIAIALLRDILLPFVAAIVGAYFLNPIADRLQANGLNRTWLCKNAGAGKILLMILRGN